MAIPKLTPLIQIGFVLAVGAVLMVAFFLDSKSNPEANARDLVPEEIQPGRMIFGEFGEKKGSALFEVNGSIPDKMRSIEPLPSVSRVTRPRVRTVNWKSTPISSHDMISPTDCSCFACETDLQSCRVAAEWLNQEGSLYYLSSRPEGTSYILNRDKRQVLVFWNRAL